MRWRASHARIGLLSGIALLGGGPASGAALELLNDQRSLYVVGADFAPSAPYRPWDESYSEDTFTGTQASRFYNDSFVAVGAVSSGFGNPQADPEADSSVDFLFQVDEETRYRVRGTFQASPLGLSSSVVRVWGMDGPNLFREKLLEISIGAFGQATTQLEFDEILLLPPGLYRVILGSSVGNVGGSASYSVRASVDPHPQDLPGPPAAAVAIALLAAWVRWGRASRELGSNRRDGVAFSGTRET